MICHVFYFCSFSETSEQRLYGISYVDDICYQIIVFVGLFITLISGYLFSKIPCMRQERVSDTESDESHAKELSTSLRSCCCVPEILCQSRVCSKISRTSLCQVRDISDILVQVHDEGTTCFHHQKIKHRHRTIL